MAPPKSAPRSGDRVETGWRSVGELADDPQDLARRGLLLERLGQLVVPVLELREQPHVLDGDDRLIGEGLHQLDLSRRKALAPTRDVMVPIVAGPEHRHRQVAAEPYRDARSGSNSGIGSMSALLHAGSMRMARAVKGPRLGGGGNGACDARASGSSCGRRPGGPAPVEAVQIPERRRRTVGCAAQDGVENRLHVGLGAEMTRRISAVAVCCSRASVKSRFRASSSVNSRTFSMAMTAWSANVSAGRSA